MTDEQLVQRMADGDQAAFEALIHRYHGPLLGYLERHLYKREKAEDFVQETFLRLIRQLKKGRVPEQIRPWLYRVALNLCRDYWKSLTYQSEIQQVNDPPERRDEGPSIVEIFERQETRKEILLSLNQLGDTQKEIIILRFYQDLKLHEISEVMDLPLSTVKTNLYQGLKKLRSSLSDESVSPTQKKEGKNTYA
ncbi:RNA polymerase sigma factor [Paenibacillus sp. J2TS4]|uniref:RNA polymerase sigma factor n=1 Tax=Paenibacillus sp. J2TS4 TaxID=2807194 RepID=UPI001B09069E|nr:RNA polymerase sigma factor [Paenibacillus sp. J2TS4]GIP35493.1 RNA polymerase sigma24 factor [Paenibacillus sp. J2TS4]